MYSHINAVRKERKLKGITKYLLLTLATHANQDNECWVSLSTLSQEMGINLRTVKRIIASLISTGYINKLINKDETGNNMVTKYTINLKIPYGNGTEMNWGVGAQDPQGRGCTPLGVGVVRPPKDKPIDKLKDKHKENCKRKVLRTDFPENFEFTEKHYQLAQDMNLNIKEELEKLKDYSQSHGKKYANWNATFNNWLRNSYKFKRKGSNHDERPKYVTYDSFCEKMERDIASGTYYEEDVDRHSDEDFVG